jgi:hypothetical protein
VKIQKNSKETPILQMVNSTLNYPLYPFIEFRLFKIVEKGSNEEPKRILRPTERQEHVFSGVKVLLLSSSDASTVAEAVLVPKENISEISKKESMKSNDNDLSEYFNEFRIDTVTDDQFVYDVYRLDLGRYSSKDIKDKVNCVEIVRYDQEQLVNEEGSDESEHFEDDSDSNAEDYYANDYPEEDVSYILDSESEDKDSFSDSMKSVSCSVFSGNFDQISFDDSVHVEDGEEFSEYSFEGFDETLNAFSDSDSTFGNEYCYDESL